MSYFEKKYRERITAEKKSNALLVLISICLILFVGFAFLKAIWYFKYNDNKEMALSLFNKNVMGWFVLPASFEAFLQKPWTIITHMFVHGNIWRIISNMLWLWCFGHILQSLTGNKKIIPVFFYGSLGGAIAFLLAYNLIPSLHPYATNAISTGAAAGIMAVAVVTTMVSPGYRLFPMIKGGMPLWVLTVIYIVADLATISISDTGALLSHISGAITGFLFILFLRRGYDWSEWMNNLYDWVNNLFNPDKPAKGKIPIRQELFYKSTGAPFKKTANLTQQRIDEILDKINLKGYHFLTEEEKDLLKRASQEDL